VDNEVRCNGAVVHEVTFAARIDGSTAGRDSGEVHHPKRGGGANVTPVPPALKAGTGPTDRFAQRVGTR